MITNRLGLLKLLATWFGLLALILPIIYFGGQYIAVEQLKNNMVLQFEHALDETYFSDKSGRVNDRTSIRFMSQRLNEDLENIVITHWLSPFLILDLAVIDVDGIDRIMEQGSTYAQTLSFTFTRNQSDRTVTLAYLFQPKLSHIVFFAALLFLFLAMTNRFLPQLSKDQFAWQSRLFGDGYGLKECGVLLSNYAESLKNLTAPQESLINQLYNTKTHNFEAALICAVDSRLFRATKLDLEWLAYSLNHGEDNAKEMAEKAVAIATTFDTVVIDLAKGALNIRSVEIQLTKTPLFYYAWYAMQRKKDDGWYLNPPSNKPDFVVGKGIADLMWRYNGHAKAISDLEEQGLKAKTLDQNRSKIKDELVTVLGATLASHYLFESEKDAASGRLVYRFKPEADQVKFVE